MTKSRLWKLQKICKLTWTSRRYCKRESKDFFNPCAQMHSNALNCAQMRSNALTWPMRKAFSFAPPLISHICLRSHFMKKKNESLYSHSRSSQKRSQWPFFFCSSLSDVEAKIIWWQKKPFQLSAKENALQFIIMHSCNVYFGLKRERGGWFIWLLQWGFPPLLLHGWSHTTMISHIYVKCEGNQQHIIKEQFWHN